MKNEKETIFKNTVGRPTNEIKKKRKVFAFFIAFLIMTVVSVGVLSVSNINYIKEENNTSKLGAASIFKAPQLYCVSDANKNKSITSIEVNKPFRCYTSSKKGIKLSATKSGLSSGYSSSYTTKKGTYWIKLKYSKAGVKTITAKPILGTKATVKINVKLPTSPDTSDSSGKTKTTTKSTTKTTTKSSNNSKTISNIVTINQYSEGYPAGCEPISLYILLKYYGVNVTLKEFMDVVPKNGSPYVDDPEDKFLGDPGSNNGWGIYPGGLKKAADKLKKGIINGTGMNFSKVYELIDSDRPVVVWTFDWTSERIKWDNKGNISGYTTRTWESKNGTVTWISPNHAVVVIGYDKDNIIISDPIDGKIKGIPKKTFENAYNIKGKKALYY